MMCYPAAQLDTRDMVRCQERGMSSWKTEMNVFEGMSTDSPLSANDNDVRSVPGISTMNTIIRVGIRRRPTSLTDQNQASARRWLDGTEKEVKEPIPSPILLLTMPAGWALHLEI